MRIVSLLPAATEWLFAFGAGEEIVGRSHECDFPAAVQDVPVVTQVAYDAEGDSAAINDAVQSTLQDGLSLYEVDLDRLRALDPDLIVTQAQCEVCAVSRSDLEASLQDWTGQRPEVLSMQPETLKEVLDTALRLGKAVDRMKTAMEVIADGERRLMELRRQLRLPKTVDPETLPTMVCIEWMEPLMTAGHWMPDVAEHAGARAMLAETGATSPPVEWTAIREADPDLLAVMPCGFSLEETRRDLSSLTQREGWAQLTAVREGRVMLFDGNAYFNRPGPRLYRSIELLASAVAPDRVDLDPPAEPWERGRLDAESVDR